MSVYNLVPGCNRYGFLGVQIVLGYMNPKGRNEDGRKLDTSKATDDQGYSP
jgi:hypothetical protein